MDCLFCKIINKVIPNYTVYEDDFVLAFLDIFPHAKGHTVVIPKKHFSNLSEMSEVDWQNMATALKNTQAKLQSVLNPDGFNIGINDKSVAGQVVPHVHWHIFPRYEGDGGGSVHSIIKKLESFDVKSLADKFRA
ncbi:MAG TPA: HIT family protein [Candidatus Magasanikbacteria bacterium]|nr:HIT family protein [Candidatus Magasanikbacteria bacterium]